MPLLQCTRPQTSTQQHAPTCTAALLSYLPAMHRSVPTDALGQSRRRSHKYSWPYSWPHIVLYSTGCRQACDHAAQRPCWDLHSCMPPCPKLPCSCPPAESSCARRPAPHKHLPRDHFVTSLHWFDLPQFVKEVRRVLKPHGCLAAWAIPLGSATLEVPAAPAAAAGCQAALHFIHEETLGHCWDRRKRLCDDMYREVAPSLHDFSTVLMRRLSMPAELTVDALVGYASSWSAYSIYRKRHPDKPDPLLEYRARLTKALEVQGLDAGDAVVVAHIPIVFLLAQHPRPLDQKSD